MVNRPPPRAASGGQGGEDSSSGRSMSGPRRGLEWSLRSLHKIDTSVQHFIEHDHDLNDPESEEKGGQVFLDDTAYEIFKGSDSNQNANNSVWATLSAPLRTGIVDGKKVVFELHTNVTKKPETDRSERLIKSHVVLNSNRSNWEVRIRFWMMHFSVSFLSCAFLGVFVAINAVFAGLFYIDQGHCCGDAALSYGEVFAFTIQTSSTIGYGGFVPQGYYANFLVVILSYCAILINTLFAGLLFTKFVTPIINIQFSEVMTLCNVNGLPCLSFRMGNADGRLNPLTDINVRLTYSYRIPYTDHKGEQSFFQQTEDLTLLSNRRHGLSEVWTLRHVVDESSPLFGLNFNEHPGNKIFEFTLSVDAVQNLTKSSVNVQTAYMIEDILIGHTFKNQVSVDLETRVISSDFSQMSDTEPYPVWYPARAGAYGDNN